MADERLRDKECNGGCPNNYNLFHLSIPLSFMHLSACFRGKTQCGAKPRSEAVASRLNTANLLLSHAWICRIGNSGKLIMPWRDVFGFVERIHQLK